MAVAGPAERVLKRYLPGGIALLAVSVLVTGGLSVVDQRADQRRQAREAVAQQAFREQVRPLAESVFDHVQPLKEAERGAADDASGGFSVYVDVARDDTAADAVRTARAALEDLDPPLSLQPVVDRLLAALEDFETAAERYEDIPFDDTTGTVSLLGAARAASGPLREGLATWSAAVGDLYPQSPPPVPVPLNDDAQPVRRPVSRPGYLLDVGRACGRADVLGGAGQAEPVDAESGQRAAAAEAALVRELVDGLVAVPAPPGDAVRLEREVLAPLREYGRLAEALEELATTDVTPAELVDALVAADEAAAEVATGLGDYGSQTCALFFGS